MSSISSPASVSSLLPILVHVLPIKTHTHTHTFSTLTLKAYRMNIYTEWSKKTVNPLSSLPWRSYLFQTLLGWGCLFSPVKMVVSLLHEELQCTQVQEVGGLSVKDQKQIRISNTWINHPGSVLQSIIYQWRMIMGRGAFINFLPLKRGAY